MKSKERSRLPDALSRPERGFTHGGVSRNSLPPGDEQEGPELTPPAGGYELYRHKNAGTMETRNWHGLYWARQNEEGDYEIRTVPISSGMYSMPGGIWPREGFEKHYVRAAR